VGWFESVYGNLLWFTTEIDGAELVIAREDLKGAGVRSHEWLAHSILPDKDVVSGGEVLWHVVALLCMCRCRDRQETLDVLPEAEKEIRGWLWRLTSGEEGAGYGEWFAIHKLGH